jgi:hypothetical protein
MGAPIEGRRTMSIRRTARYWLPILAAALTCTLVAAAPAGATVIDRCDIGRTTVIAPDYCNHRPLPEQFRTAGTSYKGWTYLNLNHCGSGLMCTQVYRMSMSAWSWTGSTWSRASLNNGWVYVYPYTGEWRWAWTQSSGWVAVNSGRFEIRPY